MGEELKPEIQELKNSIDTLSQLAQQFKTLSKHFIVSINQVSEQICRLDEETELKNNSTLNTSAPTLLPKPQHKSEIPEEHFIDFSFIKDSRYSSWLENLNKYSKDMAECKKKEQIISFCEVAHNTIDSAIEVLFEEEYKYINEENKTFLDAYNRVKKDYDSREDNSWELPKIYFKNQKIEVESKDFKKVGDIYVSWQHLETIRKQSFPASVRILCEIIKPNFMATPNIIKNHYHTITNMNQLRKLNAHGNSKKLNSKIKELNSYVQNLYESSENFSRIQYSIYWFIKEVHQRVTKISNN